MRQIKWMLVALFMLPFAALAQSTGGTISEMGYGKFRLKENGGTERVYLVGKKDTSYEPADWRPSEGDKVDVSYFEKKGKLVASNVKLVKLGPNSIDPKEMISPMRVTVREVGKSGIIATVKGTKQAKFTYARKRTEFVPAGWQPQVGDVVEVDFEAEQARFTFNMAYVLKKITKVN